MTLVEICWAWQAKSGGWGGPYSSSNSPEISPSFVRGAALVVPFPSPTTFHQSLSPRWGKHEIFHVMDEYPYHPCMDLYFSETSTKRVHGWYGVENFGVPATTGRCETYWPGDTQIPGASKVLVQRHIVQGLTQELLHGCHQSIPYTQHISQEKRPKTIFKIQNIFFSKLPLV